MGATLCIPQALGATRINNLEYKVHYIDIIPIIWLTNRPSGLEIVQIGTGLFVIRTHFPIEDVAVRLVF